MSDEQTTEAPKASGSRDAAAATTSTSEAPGGSDENPSGAATPDGGPPKRRRRRGSRGGRNRRKRPASAQAASTDDAEGDEDDRDATADRGLTTDDVAVEALEDAGLRKPQIGDTRPAPPAPARPRAASGRATSSGSTRAEPDARTGADADPATPAAPRRRRRRGGRGRGRKPATTAGTAVEADLGVGAPGVDLEALDDEALERRRGRSRKGRPTGRYSIYAHIGHERTTQIAVLEGRVLVEHYVSRPEDDATSIDGNIYLGKVQNVLPGMEAAFIDIGTPKNGVLYRGDVAFDPNDVEERQPRIEQMLRNGQSVLVQVTKNPIGAKGARLTQEVSLAGRFVVMVPSQPNTYGISKRLPDDERKRLRRVLDSVRPSDAGLIVRTAAEGATAEELERDLQRLQAQWEQISTLAARAKPGTLLYKEPALAVRIVREEFTKEYRSIVIDDDELYEEIRSYVEAIAPELADRVERYDDSDPLPMFERYHVHEQLVKALERKVWLPSGGSLVVERTEAFTVVDVNTGKNVGRSNLEETVFRNNLEAAAEVARQLRLRDIGGIIVIDFIDMEIKKNREQVLQAFKDALARDKTRTQVFDISELGLVEMTRKRVSEGLVEAFSDRCDVCHGRGFLIDESML